MTRVVRLRDGDGRVRAGVADGAQIEVFDTDDPLTLLDAGDGSSSRSCWGATATCWP